MLLCAFLMGEDLLHARRCCGSYGYSCEQYESWLDAVELALYQGSQLIKRARALKKMTVASRGYTECWGYSVRPHLKKSNSKNSTQKKFKEGSWLGIMAQHSRGQSSLHLKRHRNRNETGKLLGTYTDSVQQATVPIRQGQYRTLCSNTVSVQLLAK